MIGLLLISTPAWAAAQDLDFTIYGLAATNAEVDHTRQARGFGAGINAGVDLGSFRAEVRGETASLHADFSVQPDYSVGDLSALVLYRWWPALALEIGAGRRLVSPDLVAQEVGVVRVGLLSGTRLSSFGRIQASAAYLPVTRWSGGGDAGLAFEIGFGVSVGPAKGRFAGIAEYFYQRIDREVNGEAVPIQFSAARIGITMRP